MRSLRVAVVGFVIIIVIFFLVVVFLFVLFLVGLLSKEEVGSYRVDQERLSRGILDVLWSWTDGTPQCYGTARRSSGSVMFVPGWTLMIKLVYCITKKAGLSDEEFFRYWENVHGPIGARIPRLRKLVQSRRLTIQRDERRSDYDGMAELWFDDMEDLLAARLSPEWKASSEDEANFIDHSKVAYFVSEERVILDAAKQDKAK